MKYFKKDQVLVIDGRELRLEPWVSVKVISVSYAYITVARKLRTFCT